VLGKRGTAFIFQLKKHGYVKHKALKKSLLRLFPKNNISTEAQINRYFSAKGNHKGLPLQKIA